MDKYIGTVEVCSSKGHDMLEGAKGAFVNVVCLACSVGQFESMVRAVMTDYHLDVLAIRDVGRVSERVDRNDLAPQLVALADSLSPEFPVQFGDFQAYEEI